MTRQSLVRLGLAAGVLAAICGVVAAGSAPSNSGGGMPRTGVVNQFTADNTFGANAGTTRNVNINSAVGNIRALTFQTAGVNRWQVLTGSVAETGSNAGSDFALQAFTDAGASLDFPITINRASTGPITTTRVLRAPDGALTGPSYSFSGETNSGLYRRTAGAIAAVVSGAAQMEWAADNTRMRSTVAFGWTAGAAGGSTDTNLNRDAADTVAQRRGTNANTFRVYRTFTDASNYERLSLGSSAGVFSISAETAGTGTDDLSINLVPAGTGTIQVAGAAVQFPKTFTAVYDPASLAANTSRCDDVTVTGITTTGGAVAANIGAVDPGAGCVVATVRASATNTVRICWRNAIDAVTACDTGSSTWTFTQAQ